MRPVNVTAAKGLTICCPQCGAIPTPRKYLVGKRWVTDGKEPVLYRFRGEVMCKDCYLADGDPEAAAMTRIWCTTYTGSGDAGGVGGVVDPCLPSVRRQMDRLASQRMGYTDINFRRKKKTLKEVASGK